MDYPDIYFTAEYQDLFKDTTFGGEPCHVNFSGIDYRFYRRPIEGTPYHDIVSPYGYSGPVAISPKMPEVGWIIFADKFEAYCQQNNIIAEFARLHPFIEQTIKHVNGIDGLIQYEHDIYYIDLTQSLDQIWKGFDKGCKSTIKKQQREQPIVKWSPNVPSEFISTYNQTMLKDHASLSYYFDLEFWKKLSKISQFIQIGTGGAILFKYGDYCSYFLAGGGNQNIILWKVIKWAQMMGCKILNLGGGLKKGDSLESFKRSFTKTTRPFCTYRKIHNMDVYKELCQAKGIEPDLTGYFPAYRR